MKKEFVYANGRISGEEMTLLSTRMWQMLLSARDLEETLRLLTDTWYGGFMQGHELRISSETELELAKLTGGETNIKIEKGSRCNKR